MTKRLLGIGTAVMAVMVTAGFAMTTRVTAADDQAQGQTQVAPPPAAQPQVGQGQGPGRGPGPGQGMGPGQGLGPGAGQGRGQGHGQGQPGMGPGQGRGGRGPGQGMGPGGRGGRGAMGGGQGMMFARLDLTADQRTQVDAIQRATRDQASALRDELEFTQSTLRRETFSDKRDNAKVTALSTKVATLEKQLLDLHLKAQTGVADLLTPTQRETMRLAGNGFGRGRGR